MPTKPLPNLLLATGATALLLLLQPAAKAQSVWTAGDGQWNNASSWSGGLPNGGSEATIENGSTVSAPAGVTGNYYELYVGSASGGSGNLLINGGLLSGDYANLGYEEGATGSAMVTSGTWRNTDYKFVGYSGTGFLTINGGLVHDETSAVGYDFGSHGSATVTSGTWQSDNLLYVSFGGTGTLNVSGGLVKVSGTTYTTGVAIGNGTINLSGNEETRGVLQTEALANGIADYNNGTAKVNFNGGVLRANGHHANFTHRYAANDITIESGGAYLDTNGFNVGISAPLGGVGALHKISDGTLTLSGSSSYAGGTVIEQGSLIAANNHAVGTGAVTVENGAVFTIQTGVTLANTVMLEGGGLLNSGVAKDASLAGALNASTTLGGGTTNAQLRDGTASEATTLQASFSGSSTAINDEIRLGGVLSLSGVRVTDQFVLQLAVAGITANSFLGWLDTETNEWVNAVLGNVDGTAHFVGNRAYNAATDFQLGNYGVDTAKGTVWAVLNHNSDFAVVTVVPEPGTWALLAIAASGALLHRRARRRVG